MRSTLVFHCAYNVKRLTLDASQEICTTATPARHRHQGRSDLDRLDTRTDGTGIFLGHKSPDDVMGVQRLADVADGLEYRGKSSE